MTSDFKGFSVFLRRLFRMLAVDYKKLELKGSYRTTFFSADIDLFERVEDFKKVKKKVESLPKIIKQNRGVELTEIKEVNKDGVKRKYKKGFDKVKVDKDTAYIKIDFVILYFFFPQELTIIYEIADAPKSKEELIKSILEDVEKKHKNNLYKSIKRMDSIAQILGFKKLFDDIIRREEYGIIHLSINRLETLDEVRDLIGDEEYFKRRDIIKNDINRYGLKLTDNLQSKLNEMIKKDLKF